MSTPDSRAVGGPLDGSVGRPVECRPDGMPASAEERRLRRLLWRFAALQHTYYDDGEAQGTEHGIVIDFMREPVADIDAKLRALNVARAECRSNEAPVPQNADQAVGMVLLGTKWLELYAPERLKTPNAAVEPHSAAERT